MRRSNAVITAGTISSVSAQSRSARPTICTGSARPAICTGSVHLFYALSCATQAKILNSFSKKASRRQADQV